ncbi:MAG: ATP-dependent Clp protease ATP-binding subunit [Sandaracinaceae bacterium]|nr:ATP-dependent Clp protease ATP-binding subunit [Sandaracinaceae bacterium]
MTKGSLSNHALQGLLAASRKQAQRRGQRPTTAHCVLEMLQTDPDAGQALRAAGVLEVSLVGALKMASDEPELVLERASERALQIAKRHDTTGAPVVRPSHLLLAICSDPRSAAAQCFERLGVSLVRVQQELVALIAPGEIVTRPSPSESPPPRPRAFVLPPREQREPRPDARAEPRASARIVAPPRNRRVVRELPSTPPPPAEVAPSPAPPQEPASRWALDRERFPLLASLGRNLCLLAERGQIDPVLGREKELEQVLDVLCRRRGNNPLLVGAPGVGKTAIVEGLALAIVDAATGKSTEHALGGLGDRIVIEVTAGSLASGTGVRGALAEKLKKLREEVARAEGRVLLFLDEIHTIVGESAGPDDLASELKGALARGELACIGASTDQEMRKHFDRDPAFARRFAVVHVAEPSASATESILAGLLPRYEAHHGVRFEQAAVRAAVELSIRFLPERSLPDKAIGVLDLAGARARRCGASEVAAADVARVIADEAHVPVDRLLLRDGERLLALEAQLGERVVGQRRALARIADALRKGAAGFRGRRPLATFLLLGTTGVGKTETAKAIADVLFAPGAMTRFDMSEMSESHAVARLFGAPPGYVGHESGGQLTEAVRRRPYQLVLLDEIEKAHPDVLLALLPLLDEGRLTDGRGRTVDFTNTVVVMTSNLGALAATQRAHRAIGFDAPDPAQLARREGEERESRVLEAARKALPPELWNRIDEPLYFAPLEHDDVVEIARRMLGALSRTLELERGVSLVIDPSACAALAAAGGFEASLGARPMRRTVGRLVESPLAARLLGGEIARGARVRVVGRHDQVLFEVSIGGRAEVIEAE